jgi:farnesyl diphosphate synthase
VEAALQSWVPADAPAGLGVAMRYGVLDGGKRLRPLLVLAACRPPGGLRPAALRAAVAVELIHAYSLVHDDMPCMDNDVLRRGKPTVHVQFGEAQAMLAGDAMQALAFEVLTARRRASRLRHARCRRGCARCWPRGRPCRHGRRAGDRPGQRRRPLTEARCATCTAARPAPCCRPAC